jgi:hypothetical protein
MSILVNSDPKAAAPGRGERFEPFFVWLGRSIPIMLAAIAASAAQAEPAAVGSAPAETAEIIDGVRSCANRVVPGDFDPSGFTADGWLPGGRRQVRVGGLPAQHLMYGKQGGQVLDIVQITEHGSTSCLTIARLKSGDQAAEIKAAIIAEFQAQSFDAFQGDEAFKAFVLRTVPASKDLTLLTARHRFLVELVGGASQPMIKIMTTPKRPEG